MTRFVLIAVLMFLADPNADLRLMSCPRGLNAREHSSNLPPHVSLSVELDEVHLVDRSNPKSFDILNNGISLSRQPHPESIHNI
jgi:hypothetical protein